MIAVIVRIGVYAGGKRIAAGFWQKRNERKEKYIRIERDFVKESREDYLLQHLFIALPVILFKQDIRRRVCIA
jgi:hypothetical protein